jgi:glycosyltransferase involved in cell wall biosynthesis
MNILFVSSWYPSRVIEGNGIFVQQHAEAVQKLHNVFVMHIITDQNLTKSIEIDSQIINDIPTHIAYLKRTKNPFLKYYLYYKAYLKITRKISKIDITHVNVTFPLGIIAVIEKIKNKTPFIISEHWTNYQAPLNKSISFFERKITNWIITKASVICPVTQHLENAMCAFNLLGKYHPVPNIVNTNHFTPQINKKTKHFQVIHISNMDNDHKNITSILAVVAKLEKQIPNFRFKLIGNNSEQYSQKIKELNIQNIEITNHIPHQEIADQLQKTNLFVLFSNYENLPCVILESFSCGVPVVSSNVGGIDEYFPEDFGILVPAKDEEKLEKAILKMYINREKVDKQKMHDYVVKHFSAKTISATFTDIYKTVLSEKK